jgi:hypothetical protein
VRLPDPRRSRIALIGSSRFDHSPGLADLPSVVDNVTALRSVFTDPLLCGVPDEHCPVLLDAATPAELDAWLETVAGEAEDLLLVYYAGHGVVGEDDELYLTVAESDEHHIHRSGVPFAWIKAAILNSEARTRILILDCCFSGHALARMGPADTAVSAALRQVDIEGTHVLTASGANVTARAPEGMAYTAFTAALVTLLRDGVANGPEFLTVGYLFPLLEQMLRAAGMPRPHQQTKDTAGLLALVRNTGFVPDSEPTPREVEPTALPAIGLPPAPVRAYRPAEERLRELKAAYPRFSPRAYDRLAAAYYDEGYRDDAERVLVEKMRMSYVADADRKSFTGWSVRLWSLLQRVLTGYGYRPVRLLLVFAQLMAVGSVWFSASPTPVEANADDHLAWNPVLYTVDTLVPVIDLGQDGRWYLHGADQWVAALLGLAGWVMLVTVLAAAANRLRR